MRSWTPCTVRSPFTPPMTCSICIRWNVAWACVATSIAAAATAKRSELWIRTTAPPGWGPPSDARRGNGVRTRPGDVASMVKTMIGRYVLRRVSFFYRATSAAKSPDERAGAGASTARVAGVDRAQELREHVARHGSAVVARRADVVDRREVAAEGGDGRLGDRRRRGAAEQRRLGSA